MLIDCFCDKCTLQFDNKHVFGLHLLYVHGEKIEVENEPVICEENFQEPHVREKHVVDNCLKCNICDFAFISKQDLKVHNKSVHEAKKRFKCSICDASFAQKHHMKGHIASVHEGKKPFKCNICEHSFARKEHLDNHISSVHEKKRDYKCDVCDASFSQKRNLNTWQQFMKERSHSNAAFVMLALHINIT